MDLIQKKTLLNTNRYFTSSKPNINKYPNEKF